MGLRIRYTCIMILGVDCGGTKTHVLIANDAGSVLSEGFGGPFLWSEGHIDAGLQSIESAISDASSKIQQQMPIFDTAVLGIAGLDSHSETMLAKEKLTEALRNKVSGEITVVNDMLIALIAGTNNQNAVVINAGTGSSCFGFNQQGQRAKSGGLDYLVSDEGSAFYIGQEILRAAVKSEDGRGKKTMLEELVKQHYSISDITEIKTKIYGNNFHKSHIAKLSFIITQAAGSNDEVAQTILQSAIKELALAVKAVVVKLGLGRSQFDLVLVGGLFTSNTIHPQTFGAIITNMFPLVKIIIPQNPPVYGSIRLAQSRTKQNDNLTF